MITITKTFDFSAAHRLFRAEWSDEENRKAFGKCAGPNGHGHNYRLEVTIGGPLDTHTGMIADARVVQQIVDELILSEVDHQNLDIDVSWIRGRVTSVETLVHLFWERLAPAFERLGAGIQLRRLVLWETPRIFATKEFQPGVSG